MARGDVLLILFPMPAHSHEQEGYRPALEVQDTNPLLPTTMVIPFTSSLGAARFPHSLLVQPSAENGLDVPSVLMVFQLRAIDKSRIDKRIGQIESSHLRTIESEMKALLGL